MLNPLLRSQSDTNVPLISGRRGLDIPAGAVCDIVPVAEPQHQRIEHGGYRPRSQPFCVARVAEAAARYAGHDDVEGGVAVLRRYGQGVDDP